MNLRWSRGYGRIKVRESGGGNEANKVLTNEIFIKLIYVQPEKRTNSPNHLTHSKNNKKESIRLPASKYVTKLHLSKQHGWSSRWLSH